MSDVTRWFLSPVLFSHFIMQIIKKYTIVIPLQPRLQMYRGIQYIKYTPKRYYNIFGSNRLFYVVSGARFATEVAKCVAKITCFLQLCNSRVTYPTRQLHKTQLDNHDEPPATTQLRGSPAKEVAIKTHRLLPHRVFSACHHLSRKMFWRRSRNSSKKRPYQATHQRSARKIC